MPTKKTSATAERHEAILNEQAVLAGVPELLPPTMLRARQRGAIIVLSVRTSELASSVDQLDVDHPDAIASTYELLGDIDEFFESIAVDRDAYLAWSQGLQNSEQIFAVLVTKYARAVGESTSSSTGSTDTAES